MSKLPLNITEKIIDLIAQIVVSIGKFLSSVELRVSNVDLLSDVRV